MLQRRREERDVKLVLTGGHAGSTAYAVVEELRARSRKWKIFWIGAKRAVEGTGVPTFEKEIFPKIGVSFVPIFSGRVQRKFSIWTIPSLLKIPFGFLHALYLLLQIKPKIVVSFGGFAAFPVVIVAWGLRIPVIVHEQTVAVGRANKYSAFFADKIALARRQSARYFPKDKIVVVGNPVSTEIAKIMPKDKKGFPPALLITGGSRGSVFINDLIDSVLETLLEKYTVIHQTGVYQYSKFKRRKSGLGESIKKRYRVHGLVPPWDWYKLIKSSDIVVSRAGANVVSEIIYVKRPAIFIPLPFSYHNEQVKNAHYAQKYGTAIVLEQKKATPKIFLKKIDSMNTNWLKIVNKAKDIASPDKGAAKRFVDLIESYAQ